MKDAHGYPLAIGRKVVCIYKGKPHTGIVRGFTVQKVQVYIRYILDSTTVSVYPDKVCVI